MIIEINATAELFAFYIPTLYEIALFNVVLGISLYTHLILFDYEVSITTWVDSMSEGIYNYIIKWLI